MEDSIFDAGMGTPLEGNAAWLVHHTLESAKALVDSLINGCNKHELSTSEAGHG
jgi:hypothetical protein